MNKKLMNEIQAIATKYNVIIKFRKIKYSGLCYPERGYMIINIGMNRNDTISTIFHELGHFYCFNNNIFYYYHNRRLIKLTKKIKKKIIRTGLKAERWVDKWSTEELFKYDTKIKPKNSYSKKYISDEFRKHLKNQINY